LFFSFVVNAFRAANSYGRDYERLVELANFCAHVSTQLGLETEWCSAIQELCCSNVSNNSNWNEMLFEINVRNFLKLIFKIWFIFSGKGVF